MSTIDITIDDLKEFIKRVSVKFSIPKKELSLMWNELVTSEGLSEVAVAATENTQEQLVVEPSSSVSAGCVAIKKDKTVCGKPATHGDRCSVHKKKVPKAAPLKGEDIPEYQENTPEFIQKYVSKQPSGDAPSQEGCVAVKKDKTVCGKPATHGDRCSVHKKKVKSTPAQVSKDIDELSSLLEAMLPMSQGLVDNVSISNIPQEVGLPENKASVNTMGGEDAPKESQSVEESTPTSSKKQQVTLTMHQTLGLKWDWTLDPSKKENKYSGTRFVFYTKNTEVPTVIAKYQERIKKLTEEDIQTCIDMGLAYQVTEIADIVNEYPIGEDGDFEYNRIKVQALDTYPSGAPGCKASGEPKAPATKDKKVKNLATNPRKFPKKKNSDIVETLEEVLSN
jgi:hypothetical protein